MIHLDTSFLIPAVDPESPETRKLQAWIREGESFAISVIV